MVADVFDGLATLETGSVDLVVTSPPFLALRSYLPVDHPDKAKEIGSEATPAEFIDVMLRVSAELRRVLAPHGSICIELGDTYAGDTGGHAGGDNIGNGRYATPRVVGKKGSQGWPLPKSKALIAELYRVALAYGINPLTGTDSPAGRWRIRNVVTWVRPNPPVGALGDKWRPATSDLVVACTSPKRYWDDLATRKPQDPNRLGRTDSGYGYAPVEALGSGLGNGSLNASGAPLLDWWEIPPGGYKGSHYAVYPEELVVPCVQAMCPPKVCRTCGEPSRRIVELSGDVETRVVSAAIESKETAKVAGTVSPQGRVQAPRDRQGERGHTSRAVSAGWSDCGHDDWRPGLILDPFAGSGTTLAVATGYGHDAIGIDLDPRNAELALDRVGPFLLEVLDIAAADR